MDFETKDDLIIANMYEETHGAEDVKSGTDVFEETRGAKYVESGTVTRRGLWTEGNLGGRNGSPAWNLYYRWIVGGVCDIYIYKNK